MNQEIRYLERLNREEQFGYFLLEKGKKILLWSLAGIALVVLTILAIKLVNQRRAKKFIQQAETTLTQTLAQLSENKRFIETNAQYFVEKNAYFEKLTSHKDVYTKQKSSIEGLKQEKPRDIIRKFRAGYLESFKPNKELTTLLDEIQSVYTSQNKLVDAWVSLGHHRLTIETRWEKETAKRDDIQENTTYARVKQTTTQKFGTLESSFQAFKKSYDERTPFTKGDIGKPNYAEILKLLGTLKHVEDRFNAFSTNSDALEKYYSLLKEQYYTKVLDQFVSSNTAYETESNPAFREWQETESYTDTETYYETESYSSTCTETTYKTTTTIIDGKAVTRSVPVSSSVPCTKTRQVSKTRPVTRTRTVTKNNGEPRYIDVPYTTFSFKYTVEHVTQEGSSESGKVSGTIKKRGVSPSQPSYTYKKNEGVGYVVWKEKWNDHIQEGFIRPYLKP